MTDNTQPDSASTTSSTHIIRYALELGLLWIDGDGRDKVREALDALDTLEAQLEAIGAGGVSGPLMGQPQAVPDLSALTERGAKAWTAVDAQGLREGFIAADMATASAQGFRDGVASVAANAREPVYQARYQKGFWQDSSRERYEYLQNPENTCAENWETRILYTHPPTAQAGGWISVQDELPKCSKKPDSFGVEVLIWPPHEDGSRTAFYGRRQSREPNFYKYGALLGHVEFWRYPPPSPTSAEGVEHG